MFVTQPSSHSLQAYPPHPAKLKPLQPVFTFAQSQSCMNFGTCFADAKTGRETHELDVGVEDAPQLRQHLRHLTRQIRNFPLASKRWTMTGYLALVMGWLITMNHWRMLRSRRVQAEIWDGIIDGLNISLVVWSVPRFSLRKKTPAQGPRVIDVAGFQASNLWHVCLFP